MKFKIKYCQGVHEWPTTEFYWLTENLIMEMHPCTVTKKCSYTTIYKSHLKEHEKVCTGESVVMSKQIALGRPNKILTEMIEAKIISKSLENYRSIQFACFDIETLEEEKSEFINEEAEENRLSDDNIQAIHKLVSIATSSNIEDDEDMYFERRSSAAEDEQILVNEFLDHLFSLASKYAESIPEEIEEAINDLNTKIDAEKAKPKRNKNENFVKGKHQSWFHISKWQRYRRHLLSYYTLNIYGFNSGKLVHDKNNLIIYLKLNSIFL